MYVCMYVCMYVSIYLSIHRVFICLFLCWFVSLLVFTIFYVSLPSRCPRGWVSISNAGDPEIAPRLSHRLVGPVVEASASRAEDPGLESRLRRDFSGSSHTSDFTIGASVATLPGAWCYRVSAGTGWPSVSRL